MNKTKRYMLFAGVYYSQRGGMKDFVGSFDDLALAKQKERELLNFGDPSSVNADWTEIFDTQTGTIIVF